AGRAGGPRNAALHAGGSGPPLREDLRARAEHRQGGAGPGGARLRRRLPRPNVSRAGQPRRAGGRVHAQERRDARGAREARVRGGGLARREPGRHPEARHAGRRGDPLAARRPVAVTAGHPAPASPADPHAPESPPIQVDGLWRSYRRGRVRAVRGVSFAVPRGEVFGLIGPDGAGKTSVLQVLAGVLRADAGTVRVAGVDVSRDPEAVKEAIGYMPQGLGLNLYDSLTVEENIEFFRDLRRVPAPQYRDNRERLLRMTRLGRFLDRPAGALSGGMRQKLALICTLIHLPDVLLLDEPTTGVDPISRRDFWSIIHTLVASRGVTVLMTTAYMDEAERCHRVSLMHDGTVIAAGPPDALTAALAGRVWTIQGGHPDEVVAALRASAAMRSAAIAGGEVRVLTEARDRDPGETLTAAGLSGFTVAAVPPSFEDVFVERITREGAAPVGVPARLLPTAAPRAAGAGVVAEQLTCRFGTFTAVDRVSLTVAAGEILGLLGP